MYLEKFGQQRGKADLLRKLEKVYSYWIEVRERVRTVWAKDV